MSLPTLLEQVCRVGDIPPPCRSERLSPGSQASRIYEHLTEHGPKTSPELQKELGIWKCSVGTALHRLRGMGLVKRGGLRESEDGRGSAYLLYEVVE